MAVMENILIQDAKYINVNCKRAILCPQNNRRLFNRYRFGGALTLKSTLGSGVAWRGAAS